MSALTRILIFPFSLFFVIFNFGNESAAQNEPKTDEYPLIIKPGLNGTKGRGFLSCFGRWGLE